MEQLDKAATQNVLRAISVAGRDLDEVLTATGISHSVLVKRLREGGWKLQELGLIARAVGCRTTDLVGDEAA